MLMAEAFYLVVGFAQQHIDQMTDAITLAGTVDGRQRLTRRLGGIPGLHAIDAIVAMPAWLGHVFVEIGQQGLSAATGFFAQGEHGVELVLLQTLMALVTFGVLQHLLEHQHVLQTVSHPGIGRQAITPGPAGFLIVGLKRFGQVHVRNKTHVGFVDAHAERDGRHHDQPFLIKEAFLVGSTCFRGQPGVIRQRGIAVFAQKYGHFIDFLARQAVDNASIAAPFGEERQQLFARLFLGHDAIEDVWPVEAGQKALGVLQVQARDDFFTGTLVGGGSQRNARHIRKQLGQLPQLQVLRAEIMTPLRYAVRFINGKQGNLKVLQERQHARRHQALRGEVEHFHFAQANAVSQFALLLGTEGGVERSSGHTEFIQRGDLIVHQRNERRDDHTEPLTQQPRHLKTQGLATTGRHQHQCIATVGYTLDNGTLATTKAVVTEDVFKYALCLLKHKNPGISCCTAKRGSIPERSGAMDGSDMSGRN
ncbi:hypothetical protein ALQ88_05894 [Pseudomonas savastanoi]|nr:hypothetical protein ALQ88_05894 [Pseudomonas savastanoi]